MRRSVIVGIFILSGAAGLIFEVVWSRQLVLVFGNTTYAISAILTGFFGGMAIGSWIGGRAADSVRRPLQMYGILEVALAVIVLLTPVTFGLIHEVYRSAFSTLENTRVALALLRFALALIALAPATILMGATLPTLTRYLATNASQVNYAFTTLYAANTMGAVFGAAAAGLVLIEFLGLSGTLRIGAACSMIAGLIALALAQTEKESVPITTGKETATASDARGLALGFAFVSGFTSLSYQTVWTRLIASGTGGSTYVFTTILTIFLIGLAMGSVEYKRIRTRVTDVTGAIAASQILIALLALGGLMAMDAIEARTTGYFIKAVIIVLPTTFVMGFCFPAASALLGGSAKEVGARSGSLLAANTLGAILGTFFVPFVLIRLIGSPNVVVVTALVNAVTGVAIAIRSTLRWRRVAIAGAAMFGLLLATAVASESVVDPNVARMRRHGSQIYRSTEDEIAAVQAGKADGRDQLWVTGFSMTMLTVDAKLMPILPLMIRPDSKSVLTIAFGMGSSHRAALIAGMRSDAVELVPSVPGMFDVFYPDAARFESDSLGRILIGDGRSHVELTDRRYDIVVVDPPPPLQSSGVSIISSLEFYLAAKARLTPGGVMMQWVPWGQTLPDFKNHLRTFRAAFQNVLVAEGPGGNGFYMLGSARAISLDSASILSVLQRPGVREDLSSAYDSPAMKWEDVIPKLVRMSGDDVAAFTGEGPLITDDKPLPEYFIWRSRESNTAWLNRDEVRAPQRR